MVAGILIQQDWVYPGVRGKTWDSHTFKDFGNKRIFSERKPFASIRVHRVLEQTL